jgi:hypothetical protein
MRSETPGFHRGRRLSFSLNFRVTPINVSVKLRCVVNFHAGKFLDFGLNFSGRGFFQLLTNFLSFVIPVLKLSLKITETAGGATLPGSGTSSSAYPISDLRTGSTRWSNDSGNRWFPPRPRSTPSASRSSAVSTPPRLTRSDRTGDTSRFARSSRSSRRPSWTNNSHYYSTRPSARTDSSSGRPARCKDT